MHREDELHLSDGELVAAGDGELAAAELRRAEQHLAACWVCRARKQELERAIGEVVRHQQAVALPAAAGRRALLRAQIAGKAAGWFPKIPRWAVAAAACGFLALGLGIGRRWRDGNGETARTMNVPDHRLTPGAAVLATRWDVCRETSENNKMVSVSVQRQVFAAYGLTHAEPRAYEVDYLITPALGGADDIRNLWPQSYSDPVWNAKVKDALEDRLHDLVCRGELDLATAQHDLADNWIEAYKKYFGTDRPVSQ